MKEPAEEFFTRERKKSMKDSIAMNFVLLSDNAKSRLDRGNKKFAIMDFNDYS